MSHSRSPGSKLFGDRRGEVTSGGGDGAAGRSGTVLSAWDRKLSEKEKELDKTKGGRGGGEADLEDDAVMIGAEITWVLWTEGL